MPTPRDYAAMLPSLNALKDAFLNDGKVSAYGQDNVQITRFTDTCVRDTPVGAYYDVSFSLFVPRKPSAKEQARIDKIATLQIKHVRALVRGLMNEMTGGNERFREEYVTDTVERVLKYLRTGSTNGGWSDLQCGVSHEVAKVFGFADMF